MADVNVNVTWAKTDGTCDVSDIESTFHNETNFRIDGPTANEILLLLGSYTGMDQRLQPPLFWIRRPHR